MRRPKFPMIWDKQVTTHEICYQESRATLTLYKDVWRAGAMITISLYENNRQYNFFLVLRFTSPMEAECLAFRLVESPNMLPAICLKNFKTYGNKCTLYNITLN
jgi:hypothetical protein